MQLNEHSSNIKFSYLWRIVLYTSSLLLARETKTGLKLGMGLLIGGILVWVYLTKPGGFSWVCSTQVSEPGMHGQTQWRAKEGLICPFIYAKLTASLVG